MLDEQRGAEAFFDGLDVPRHGGVGGVQASGGGQQAAAALQLEKNRRSFQSNMNRPCLQVFKNAQQLRKN
jgi:hypothetical protein